MRFLLLAAALAAAPGLAAADRSVCADARKRYAAMEPAPPGTVVVLMYQYTFCPDEITVKPGTTVRWVNVERTSHSVWLKDRPESDRLFVGENWEFTFVAPGEYPYLCGPHESNAMAGRVIVAE